MTPRMRRLIHEFEQAVVYDVEAGSMGPEEMDLAPERLKAARKALFKEINLLHNDSYTKLLKEGIV